MSSKYLQLLSNAKTEYIVSTKFSISLGEDQSTVIVIPACNTDIRFQVGNFKLQMARFSLSKEDEQLPEAWQNFSNDKNVKDKRLLLSLRPVSQGNCGSCFAVSTATVISDNFLFGMNLKYNPNLSPMYLLSCLKDSRYNSLCGGGNPSGVIDDIINKGGISTSCCLDYYKICENDKYCSSKVEQTLDHQNSMIDKLGCGCCPGTGDIHKLYKVKDRTVSFDIPQIKRHLLQYGSAVGGFIVYANFVSVITLGKFKETNGIYIQSVNYSNNEEDITKSVGAHAISIVGWGSEKITFKDYKGNEYKDITIKYWVCRNSWGTEWGENGYFKYAMYHKSVDPLPDINAEIAFEFESASHDQDKLGGIVLITPESIDDGTTLLEYSANCDPSYTCNETKGGGEGGGDGGGNKFFPVLTERLFINILLYLCLFILCCVCIYYLFDHKGKSKRHSRK